MTTRRPFSTLTALTLALALGLEWQPSIDPVLAAPRSPQLLAQAGTGDASLAWTERYANALEAQTDLVVTAQPLTATLTRIELAQWMAEFLGYIPDRAQAQIIADMTVDTPDYWTAQAVVQTGAMRLFDGNEFRPQGDMTKLEALAILVRALQIAPPTEAEVEAWLSQYTDGADVPEVGRPLVAMAGRAGLILNVPDPDQLTPNLILRRGEGIALLHQVLVYRQQLPPIDPPVPQLTPAGAAVATAATPPPVAPTTGASDLEIFAVQVNPDAGTVPAGMSVTVTAQGTPGGQATVDLGPVQGIPMQEIQPGLYQGSYTVRAGDGIQSPDVGVQLTQSGRSTRLQKRQPQLALGDTAPPPIDTPVFNDPGTATPFPAPQPTPLVARPPSPTVPAGVAVPSGDYPEFSFVRIEPERDLQQGDIVTLNLWGDSGATARFDFGSLATGQPMREIKTNLYEGTYVVQAGDQASNPVVKILLSQNGLTTQHAEIFPFRIDGTQGDPLSSQTPSTPAAATGQPQITSVSANTVGRRLQVGEILSVTMRGDQGGTATFEIVNVTPPIPMRQVSPGLYEGQVQIGENTPAIDNGILQVTLERNGRQTTQSLNSLVMIGP